MVPVVWSSRSANVLLPWSMWAMMQKLRMFFMSESSVDVVQSCVPQGTDCTCKGTSGITAPPDFVILARLTHATFDDAACVLFTTYCLNP